MSDEEIVKEFLPLLSARLAEVCGDDLAESLVFAGRGGGALNLDMQLTINDGLEQLDEAKRERVLEILTDFRRQVRAARENASG